MRDAAYDPGPTPDVLCAECQHHAALHWIGEKCQECPCERFVHPSSAATSLPWRCRCTEPAPDRIGVVRVRRPGDESSCPRCGSTQAEYEAELEKGVDLWGASDFDGPQFCSKEHRDGVPTAGASLLEQGFPHLISVASQSWKGVTSGESEKDHGCTEEGYDGANGVTLCGRKMGMRWFPRGERFDGAHSFHCERCVRAGVKRGLIDPSKLDKKFKGKGIGRAA